VPARAAGGAGDPVGGRGAAAGRAGGGARGAAAPVLPRRVVRRGALQARCAAAARSRRGRGKRNALTAWVEFSTNDSRITFIYNIGSFLEQAFNVHLRSPCARACALRPPASPQAPPLPSTCP
jgi:hypothetical protein